MIIFRARRLGLGLAGWPAFIVGLIVVVVGLEVLALYAAIWGLIWTIRGVLWLVRWYRSRPIRPAPPAPAVAPPDPAWQAAYDRAKAELEEL